jgi:hypothetical protein
MIVYTDRITQSQQSLSCCYSPRDLVSPGKGPCDDVFVSHAGILTPLRAIVLNLKVTLSAIERTILAGLRSKRLVYGIA